MPPEYGKISCCFRSRSRTKKKAILFYIDHVLTLCTLSSVSWNVPIKRLETGRRARTIGGLARARQSGHSREFNGTFYYNLLRVSIHKFQIVHIYVICCSVDTGSYRGRLLGETPGESRRGRGTDGKTAGFNGFFSRFFDRHPVRKILAAVFPYRTLFAPIRRDSEFRSITDVFDERPKPTKRLPDQDGRARGRRTKMFFKKKKKGKNCLRPARTVRVLTARRDKVFKYFFLFVSRYFRSTF